MTDHAARTRARRVPVPAAALRTHARIRFRHLNLIDREEAVTNVAAYAFASFLRLKKRGRIRPRSRRCSHTSSRGRWPTGGASRDASRPET